jgi:hypothetical protein
MRARHRQILEMGAPMPAWRRRGRVFGDRILQKICQREPKKPRAMDQRPANRGALRSPPSSRVHVPSVHL